MAKLLISLTDYIKYLKKKGLVPYGRRSGGTHERWDYPDGQKKLLRPCTVDHHFSEVPEDHIRTNAFTLGINLAKTRDEMIEMGDHQDQGQEEEAGLRVRLLHLRSAIRQASRSRWGWTIESHRDVISVASRKARALFRTVPTARPNSIIVTLSVAIVFRVSVPFRTIHKTKLLGVGPLPIHLHRPHVPHAATHADAHRVCSARLSGKVKVEGSWAMH